VHTDNIFYLDSELPFAVLFVDNRRKRTTPTELLRLLQKNTQAIMDGRESFLKRVSAGEVDLDDAMDLAMMNAHCKKESLELEVWGGFFCSPHSSESTSHQMQHWLYRGVWLKAKFSHALITSETRSLALHLKKGLLVEGVPPRFVRLARDKGELLEYEEWKKLVGKVVHLRLTKSTDNDLVWYDGKHSLLMTFPSSHYSGCTRARTQIAHWIKKENKSRIPG
jgi:hypothetical protein